MTRKRHTITLQIGCRAEWHAFEAALRSIGYPEMIPLQLGPFTQYHALKIENIRVIAFLGGPSKSFAAAAAQHAISTFSPGLHIMMGTCGGVSGHPGIGGLIFASRAVQYDCIDRLGESNGFFYKPFDVHLNNTWIQKALETLGCIEGTVATADQDINFDVRTTLLAHGADVADWESAAVALVAHRNRVPVLILRGVSDIPEAEQSREIQARTFFDMTPVIMRSLAECLPAIISRYNIEQLRNITHIDW